MDYEKMQEIYSTDDRRTLYQNQSLNVYKNVNTILFWLYYAIVIYLSYLVYNSPVYNSPMKIAIVSGMVAYPFVAYLIEYYIYSLYSYMKAVFTGTVYMQPDLAKSRV